MPIVTPNTGGAVPNVSTIASVNTFADVRLLGAGVFPVIEVLGGTTVGDGQDGVFYWKSTSVLADDGFAVLAPSVGGTGRWIRIYGSVIQSGTGALTRTVSDTLRAIVRTGDFDTAGHFNTAQAALTEKVGAYNLRVGTGDGSGIVFPTTSGAAPFQVSLGGGLFNGQFDPQFTIAAYNYGRAVASEPLLNFVMEGHYYDGAAHYMELNLDYTSLDGGTGKRFLGLTINRATHAGVWAFINDTMRIESASNVGEIVFTTGASGSINLTVGQYQATATQNPGYRSLASDTNAVDTRITSYGPGGYGTVGTANNFPWLLLVNNVEVGRFTTTGLNNAAVGATTASTLRGTSVEVTTGGSTTISTGVGSVKMSTANPATNTTWVPIKYAGNIVYVPGWLTNAP